MCHTLLSLASCWFLPGQAPYQLLSLAEAAVAALRPNSTAAKAAAAAAAAEGAAQQAADAEQPGAFLQTHRARLVLVSQMPLAQLLERLPDLSAGAAAAAAGGGVGRQPGGAAGQALKDCPSIALPALRARASDIGPLAVAAGQATAALRGYQSIELTDAAEKQLTSYDFPGNEAELKGLVHRAIMLHPAAAANADCSCGCDNTSSCSDCSGSAHAPCGGGSCDGHQKQGCVLVLDAPDFWAATGVADRGRIDMLEVLPGIRQFVLNTGGPLERAQLEEEISRARLWLRMHPPVAALAASAG